MPIGLPDFNITCEIWTGPWATKVLRLSAIACNLAWGERSNIGPIYDTAPDQLTGSPIMTLLLPAGTDVRGKLISGVGDLIEVPSGSGRWYGVWATDDRGKGFPNEHRAAQITQVSEYISSLHYGGLFWPVPYP